MESWQTILLAFGGNTALLAVLGWLGKSLLDKLIVRDAKQFESDLKAKAAAEIERIKNELLRSVESYKVQLAFLSKHGGVLADEEGKILVSAMSDAGHGKFYVIDGGVSPEANAQTGMLYENLQSLEQKLVSRVRDQSSI